ncbi:MAG TPA: chemotaxis protein CheC [Methanomassiliicoccales archaeon]|nr:chemotaxis protein CheC [Methanomassiliicoccales archaeon]
MAQMTEREYDDDFSFGELELDALKEAGNIGASHATTALSTLIRTSVMIDVPDCIVCRTEQLPQAMGLPDQQAVATFFQTYGKGTGNLLMLFSYESAIRLSDALIRREYRPGKVFDEEGKEAICEIGNICTSAYLNAMAQFLGTTILPSPPSVAVDMLSAILQYPASIVAEIADYVVILRTSFIIEGEKYSGSMIFLPDPESQKMLLEKFQII